MMSTPRVGDVLHEPAEAAHDIVNTCATEASFKAVRARVYNTVSACKKVKHSFV